MSKEAGHKLHMDKGMYSQRVKLTTSCHDADHIPKVDGAGQIFEDSGEKIQLMHNGVKVIYGGYHGSWMGEIIERLRGHHEPQEEKVFYEILKHVPQAGVMIELGSFWAYYSAWFNWTVADAKNYMIEPNVEKIEVGKKNFALNGMTGIFVNAFIGKESSDLETFIDWDGKEATLPMISIDRFLIDRNIDHVDILHSDIQGAEHDMLVGCAQSIQDQKINFFILSTHGDKHDACKSLLESAGYVVCADHTVDESFSADGLLVAHAPHIKGVGKIEISKARMSPAQKVQRAFGKIKQKVFS